METLFKTLFDYYNRPDFRRFQNTIAKEVYETLGTSYSNSDNEVKMVTDLCDIINGKSFEQLTFYSKKIHGTRSFVEFHNQDKPTTKELADIVVISVVTRQRKIIYEKTAFIQNKKESSVNNWRIDQDQLYLLNNFPTFKGSRGIFKHNFSEDVVFLNHSQTLGNYGFFQSPGEMILANALTIYKLQENDTVSLSDIRKFTKNDIPGDYGIQLASLNHPIWEELLYRWSKFFPKYSMPFMNLPFLGTCKIAFNIYEFIRHWTYFNVGEVASAFGNTVDSDLSKFTRLLLRQTGLANVIDLNVDAHDIENNLTVFVAHLNLDEKE